jgi:type IV pilus assembly protein PilA
MQREKGFSMIELLIVVAIITLIAAVAIPNLRKARQAANSASAVQSLRTISTAQILYLAKFKEYGTLIQLAPEGTLDGQLSTGNKSNYIFEVVVLPDKKHFTGTASPLEEPSQLTYYFIDETTVIRYNFGAPADASSLPIPK